MPIDYDGTNGLFTKIGKLIKSINSLESFETSTLSSKLSSLRSAMETETLYDDRARQLLSAKWDSANSILRSYKIPMANLASLILQQEMVEEENYYSGDPSSLVNYLIFCMKRDSESVLQNTITLTGPSAGSPSPQGNFSVVASKYYPTASGEDSSSQENGSIWPNKYTLECINNSVSGSETFFVRGNILKGGKDHPEWYNAGGLTTLRIISSVGNTLLSNGGFENLNTPDPGFQSWAMDTGAWDTDILQETSIVYRGSSALRLKCTTTGGKLRQTLGTSILSPYTKYLISFKARRTATSDGTLKVGFAGTSGLYKSITVSSGLTESYAIYHHFFNTGADPSDIVDFIIELSGSSSSSDSVYLDEVCLTRIDLIKGLGLGIIGGSTDPAVEDRWTVTASNNFAGKFQTFFARFFDKLLPGSGSPSISDSLAS